MLGTVVSSDREDNRRSWCEVLQEEIRLEDLNVDGRVTLKWILCRLDCRV